MKREAMLTFRQHREEKKDNHKDLTYIKKKTGESYPAIIRKAIKGMRVMV